ncbi:MAG TPA: response regulator transcription factor [Candidatus Krumholzibacteria bacterium]|nr:response regulator transcription factor [Candidatus Krumholzibacteria bacterium]HPD70483.1 response regulator transcription factor [Candidatus Krumholzibacteria bacterium]HRY39817.1 response regulator transcription factor [Candidatus Krumholzibacteria bacterium]
MTDELILVVEDEEDIQELVEYTLLRAGYRVDVTDRGEEALELMRENAPALMVLDLMLPGLGGLEVCRRVKRDERLSGLPVIILTARGEEEDIIAGFAAGADDYITKPFSPQVLAARVAAMLRRTADTRPNGEGVLEYDELRIHPGRFEVRVAGAPVALTHTEFRILQYLASRPGWVFSRMQIVRAVHGEDYPVTGRSIDVQVASLRKKLGEASRLIATVRGVGYKFGD